MDDVTVLRKVQRAACDAKFYGVSSGDPSFGCIEGYKIQEIVGCGGQARVFKAVQQSTGCSVAIKILLAGQFSDVSAKRRFERETKILASLKHPHIVSLIDQGQTSSGTHYFTMPFVDGVTFDKVFDGTLLDTSDMISVLSKVARAVHACHEANVVHRDLKPENILIDRYRHPHVLDFGLARPLSETWLKITRHNGDIGTLLWASPEQLRGGSSSVGPSADIYSLGVVLYQCLAGGRHPFPKSNSLSETIQCILETSPKPPCDDEKLNQIVFRAMSKRPEDRFATAAEMADALDAGHVATKARSWKTIFRLKLFWLTLCIAVLGTSLASARRVAKPNDQSLAMLPMQTMINTAGMNLVQLPPGGSFSRPFWIASTETTVGQWRSLLRDSSDHRDRDLPIDDVDYSHVCSFCDQLSKRENRRYRLPTEAEWEYAAQVGGHVGRYGANTGPLYAWFEGNSDEHVHKVATLGANPWGLHDMFGNVAEICEETTSSLEPNVSVSPPSLVLKGGSFADSAKQFASSKSLKQTTASHHVGSGFRIVLETR